MIKTVHKIHRRLRSVSLVLWVFKTLNATMLIISINLILAIMIAQGVIEGWRGPIVLHLLFGLGVLTMIAPLFRSIYLLFTVLKRSWIASYIENADLELNDALLTVISADRDPEIGDPEVISALRSQVSDRLYASPISKWVPFVTLRSGSYSLLAALAFSFGAVTLSDGKLIDVYRLLNESPERLSQRLAYTPLIGDIKLTITPPKYTQLPPTFIEGGSGDFEALEGSIVTVEATLSRRSSAAKLWLEKLGQDEENATPKEMNPHLDAEGTTQAIELLLNGREVSARFEVPTHLKWSVSLTDLEGVEWREAAKRRVAVKSDRPPKITISSPLSGERVDPTKDLKVSLEASDDYGLGAGTIFVALASDTENSETLHLNNLKGKKWRASDLVDLRVIQAQGGDRIALWAEVYDQRGEPLGPQKATSEVIYLELDSPEWAHRALLDALREHLELQLEALASRLELAYVEPDSPELTLPSLLMRWVNARQKSQNAQENFSELIAKLSKDELTPREIYLTFTNQLMKLEEALKIESTVMNGQIVEEGESTSASPKSELSASELQNIERKSAPVEEAHEGIIIIIEAMVARMALEEMSKLADELKVSRAHIKDLMNMYKEQPSEALKSQIMRELQRFKQKMKAMREMMAKLQKKLPAEFLNLDGMKNDEVADQLKESESQVSSIEKLLEEGKIEEAMKALDELSNSLEEMSQQLQEDREELHRQTNPELEKALSELMDSTRDLMKAQEELKRDTTAQQSAIDEAVKSSLEQAQSTLDELKAKADRIHDIEKNLKLRSDGRYLERVRADAAKAADDLKRALSQEMLDEALEAAERGESEFSRLKRLSENLGFGQRSRRSDVGQSQKDLSEATRLSEEVQETLREIKERLSSQAQRAQDREAEAQAKAQRERQRQARAEAERAQQGQPQPGQQGQPQPGQEGQPQLGQEGQPQPGQQGQPQPGQQGSPSDELARRQSQISESLDRLRSRLKERQEKIPSLNQVPTEPFDQAEQGSMEAQQQLKNAQPGRGIDGQQRVSDALQQVMNGLQQAKKPQQGQNPGQQKQQGGQQSQGSQGRTSNEKVEIPEGGDRGPKSMREALLDAMKSKPARGYDDQVKAYYDSLVR